MEAFITFLVIAGALLLLNWVIEKYGLMRETRFRKASLLGTVPYIIIGVVFLGFALESGKDEALWIPAMYFIGAVIYGLHAFNDNK